MHVLILSGKHEGKNGRVIRHSHIYGSYIVQLSGTDHWISVRAADIIRDN
jgi:hypothetical protein